MKSYLSYFKLRFITNLQYRAAAIAGILTQFFFGFLFVMVYLAFYESNGSIPMPWDQLVTYLWLQQAFYALTYPFEKDKELLDMIRTGNLAYELIRPQNFYIKWYVKLYAKKVVAFLTKSWPIFLICYFLPEPYRLFLPASWEAFFLFAVALIIASFLITGLSILFHMITIYTIDEKGVLTFLCATTEVFMGSIIPLPFFPNWLQKIAYALPFRYINDFPYRTYTGSIPLSEGYQLLFQALMWTIIIILIGYFLSKHALKKAVIQGG